MASSDPKRERLRRTLSAVASGGFERAGARVGGENSFAAGGRMGRVGPEQGAAERVL